MESAPLERFPAELPEQPRGSATGSSELAPVDRLPAELPEPLAGSLPNKIATVITGAIDDGMFRAGDRLPSEHQLSNRFGVSRQVARDALRRLAREGRVLPHQGRGYYVNQRRVRRHLVGLDSYTEQVARARGGSHTTLVARRRCATPPQFTELLGEESVWVHRTGWLEGQPVASLRGYYPLRYEQVLLGQPLENRSVTRTIGEHVGEQPESAQSIVAISYVNGELHRELGVLEGAALLALTHLAWLGDGRTFEASVSYYRGDRFEFETTTADCSRRETHGG